MPLTEERAQNRQVHAVLWAGGERRRRRRLVEAQPPLARQATRGDDRTESRRTSNDSDFVVEWQPLLPGSKPYTEPRRSPACRLTGDLDDSEEAL